jgi:hypothetical protein
VIEAAALVAAAEAVLVRSVAAFDAQELWRDDGAGCTRSWLTFRTGHRDADNGRRVRSGSLLRRHPRIGEALASGATTAAHVAILARVAIPARREAFTRDLDVLLDAASTLDVDRFERAAEQWASLADDEIDRPPRSERERLDRRRLHLRDSVSGMVAVDGLLPVASAAVVRAALDALDSPDPLDCPEGPRSPAQRAADNLVELARRSMIAPDGTTNPEATVLVTVSEEVLAGDEDVASRFHAEHLRCGLTDGRPLPPEAVRRFGCASWVATVLFSAEHEVLALGRRRRLFSAAQRRAIVARDGGCVFPGCDRPASWCQTHHLDPWGPPSTGTTDVGNGCLLCGHHHALVHEGGWSLRHDPDGGWTCFDPGRQACASADADHGWRLPPEGPTPPEQPSTRRHHRRARSPG